MAKPQKLARDPEKRDSAASTVAPAAKADPSPAAIAAATHPLDAPASPGPEAPPPSPTPAKRHALVIDEDILAEI